MRAPKCINVIGTWWPTPLRGQSVRRYASCLQARVSVWREGDVHGRGGGVLALRAGAAAADGARLLRRALALPRARLAALPRLPLALAARLASLPRLARLPRLPRLLRAARQPRGPRRHRPRRQQKS